MTGNAERMAEDLRGLGYDPVLFSTPKGHGVKFEYRIGDGSREGEVVMLGMAMRDRDGEWPEIPPHWVLVSPPDEALEGAREGRSQARSGETPRRRGRYALADHQRAAGRLLGRHRGCERQVHGDVHDKARRPSVETDLSHRVVIREAIHRELAGHLLSGFVEGPWQEEACLALWHRGDGLDRYTGIVNRVLLPGDDDRDLHGNVTVRGRYLNRAVDQAVQSEAGVAVLHSHPASGWQAMSGMDDRTERRIIAPLVRETGLPLLGLTMGMDECWSARFWQEPELGRIVPAHCTDVRHVGTRHSRADWAPGAYPTYHRRRRLRRTLDSWGIEAQARLARTHVCVVGAGSVGSIVLESLGRIGVERITIIDPDEVEEHNLDRLIFADGRCVGLRKADVAAARGAAGRDGGKRRGPGRATVDSNGAGVPCGGRCGRDRVLCGQRRGAGPRSRPLRLSGQSVLPARRAGHDRPSGTARSVPARSGGRVAEPDTPSHTALPLPRRPGTTGVGRRPPPSLASPGWTRSRATRSFGNRRV